MIELFFLLVVIPRRIRGLAKERGESTLKWSLAAIGAWIGAEILLGAILGFIWGMLTELGMTPQGNLNAVFYILYYIAIIAAAGVAATVVIQKLRKKPITVNP